MGVALAILLISRGVHLCPWLGWPQTAGAVMVNILPKNACKEVVVTPARNWLEVSPEFYLSSALHTIEWFAVIETNYEVYCRVTLSSVINFRHKEQVCLVTVNILVAVSLIDFPLEELYVLQNKYVEPSLLHHFSIFSKNLRALLFLKLRL